MRFGLLLGTHPSAHTNYYDAVLSVAQAGEAAGFDSVWFPDHFQFRNDEAPEAAIDVLECFTILAAVAASTQRVKVGAFVAGVPYRNPALLAKINTTLDLVSHGRCIIGMGAAWHEEEFLAYGWPYPALKQRMEGLEDAVRIVKAMLTERPATYLGKHYAIRDALNDPMPIQRPHPPIMLGGSGEQRTLRLVAQYADYCNVFGDPPTVARKFEVLRRHCEGVGRPYEAITRSNFIGVLLSPDAVELAAKRREYAVTLGHPVIGTTEQVITELRAFAAAGVQYVILNFPDAHTLEPIHLFAETVMPTFAQD